MSGGTKGARADCVVERRSPKELTEAAFAAERGDRACGRASRKTEKRAG
jgi:hypothetical protein